MRTCVCVLVELPHGQRLNAAACTNNALGGLLPLGMRTYALLLGPGPCGARATVVVSAVWVVPSGMGYGRGGAANRPRCRGRMVTSALVDSVWGDSTGQRSMHGDLSSKPLCLPRYALVCQGMRGRGVGTLHWWLCPPGIGAQLAPATLLTVAGCCIQAARSSSSSTDPSSVPSGIGTTLAMSDDPPPQPPGPDECCQVGTQDRVPVAAPPGPTLDRGCRTAAAA